MPLGSKTITAGINVNISATGGAVNVLAGGAVNVTAGGAVSIAGSGISLQSSGATLNQSTGLVTENLQGGITGTIVGAIARTITGTLAWIVSGLVQIVAVAIQLGITVNLRKLVHEDVFALWGNTHTHPVTAAPGNTGAPNEKVIASGTAPNVDIATVTTQNVTAS